MSDFSPDLVRHLAHLARIELTDEEVTALTRELSVIVDAVARVQEIATDDVPATSHPLPLTNVFREDLVAPSLSQQEALAAAPDAESGRFRVTAILDEE
jgi:aspartyl-tRNA(Asn)/glutamyl-tRNA(Gln) amidotransferase subunit C